jgi:hypothetical protein
VAVGSFGESAAGQRRIFFAARPFFRLALFESEVRRAEDELACRDGTMAETAAFGYPRERSF